MITRKEDYMVSLPKNKKNYFISIPKGIQSKIQLNRHPKRRVYALSEDVYGQGVVTTDIFRKYSEGQLTYEDQKVMSYESYITNQGKQKAKIRARFL